MLRLDPHRVEGRHNREIAKPPLTVTKPVAQLGQDLSNDRPHFACNRAKCGFLAMTKGAEVEPLNINEEEHANEVRRRACEARRTKFAAYAKREPD